MSKERLEMEEMSREIDDGILESVKQEVIADLARLRANSDPLKQTLLDDIILMVQNY